MVTPHTKPNRKAKRNADGELVSVKAERVTPDEYRRRRPYKRG